PTSIPQQTFEEGILSLLQEGQLVVRSLAAAGAGRGWYRLTPTRTADSSCQSSSRRQERYDTLSARVPSRKATTLTRYKRVTEAHPFTAPALVTFPIPCWSRAAMDFSSSTFWGRTVLSAATMLPVEHPLVGFCCQAIAATRSSGRFSPTCLSMS